MPENIIQPWELKVYTDEDYLDKMLNGKKGSVVIIASNNQKKSIYIEQSVKGGFNVADKPIAITQADFESLKTSLLREVNSILAKYYTTTQAIEKAKN